MRDERDPGTLDMITGGLHLGYARVSTDAQDFENQRELLRLAGCSRIFAEKVSGCHFQKTTARNIRSRLHWWIAARCTGPSCSP